MVDANLENSFQYDDDGEQRVCLQFRISDGSLLAVNFSVDFFLERCGRVESECEQRQALH